LTQLSKFIILLSFENERSEVNLQFIVISIHVMCFFNIAHLFSLIHI